MLNKLIVDVKLSNIFKQFKKLLSESISIDDVRLEVDIAHNEGKLFRVNRISLESESLEIVSQK